MYYNIDPQCDHMPDWLLNNSCKVVAAVAMKLIASKAENLPKVYKDTHTERKDYYDVIMKKFERGYL